MVSLYMPLWLQFTFLITVKSNNLDVGDIRLADGSGPFEGRVEIQVAGVWGTVCDYLFYTQEATVMCRMMGLLATSYFSGAHFGQGIGPTFAQKFDCNGSESHLRDCTFNANTFCSHSRDVGIICSECGNISISNGRVHSISADGKTLTVSCYEGFEITKNATICRNGSWSAPSLTCTPIGFTLNISDIRIVNGTGISDGTVELLVNGTWGTVCARGYSTNEGRVLCRMLGFPDVYDTSYVYSNGTGSGFIHLTNLYCTGTESHINNCTYKIEHSCDFHGDAAVICKYPFNASDIRLVDGTGLYDGRVEIFVNGTWGTVCSKYYSSYIASDAMETLCRMLSYNLTMSFTTAVYGQGSGPIFTGYIGCVGPKESINNCTTYPPRSYCSHTYDLSLVCTPCGQPDILYGYLDSVNDTVFTAKCYDSYIPEEYKLHCLENGTWSHEYACSSKYAYPLDIVDIRLVSNYRPSEGRVELLVDGEWGTICDNNFTATSAAVLCHMTGLKLQKFYIDARGYGEGQGRIYVDYLICNGSELHINNCSYNVENTCTHTEDVSVICTGYQLNITDIRLAGTSGPYHGRIELEVNGTWGTIGGDRFLSNEANAVCRMLGLQYKQVLYDAAYGQGSGPVYVDRLGCSSSNTHINQCRYSVDNYYNTKHDEDVSVICWGPTLKITAGRLANGTGPFDGRAEIKVGDTWGTICDENFNIRDADLFCRLLGLRAARYFTGALYGEGSGPIFIDQLFCDDNDVDLSSCQYLFLNECKHDQDVSVVCNECGQPDISYTDAGYFTYNGTTLYADCTYFKTYIGTLELTCDNITQTWIKNAECQEYSYPLNVTDIRLTDGPTKTNGRVEIKSLDVWGTLCDDNFGMAEANVICNMIGHPPAVAFFPGAHYGEGTGPIFVDDISCSDDATYISNCTYNTYDNCHHIDDISVNCTDCGDPKPENGYVNSSATNYGAVIEVTCNRDFKLIGEQVITCQLTGAWNDEPRCDLIGPTLNITGGRLVNGTGPFDGRAEIKVGDTWGTICDENFNIRDADLFCRLFGLRAARFFTGALYGEGSGPIFIDQLFCGNSDADLSSCQYLFLNECKHDQDVSVVCNECGQPDISYWDAGYLTYNGTTVYADCSYYKTYLGTLELTCDNINQTWIKDGECKEYSYPLNVTDIRLADGPTKTNGRVEIKSLGVWGTICDDNFGMAEADVICNMIRYPPAVAFFNGTHYGEGTGPIFVDDMSCGDDAEDINNCTYNTYDDCYHYEDISVNCTDCGDPKPENGYLNSSSSNYGAVIEVTCNRDFKLVGEQVITCQITGAWNDEPMCELIECVDPTPEHGFSNTSSAGNGLGTVVYVSCDEGYNMSGDAIVTCQNNETWTDNTICNIIDCGDPSRPEFADINLPNNKTTYGETIAINCWTGYHTIGNQAVSCLSNGNWETMPTCEIVDCGDPSPYKASINSSKTTYNSAVEITCDPGYNITGNSTIICQEDGTWTDSPVCDVTDCGKLSIANGNVNDSLGTTVGAVATIECDEGYDLIGSSVDTCSASVRGASWNYSASCIIQVCEDPTPDNGKVFETDKLGKYEFGNYAEIECDEGHDLLGDTLITCIDGGIWSDTLKCEIVDCGTLTVPDAGYMDSKFGTTYNAKIVFSCSEGYLLVGEETTICGEHGDWSNEPPTCVKKSAVGEHCIDETYCLMDDSRCFNSVCTCVTGIYDNRTKKCDVMPLMRYGVAEGDVSVPKNNVCGPKISFEPGFPIFEEFHTELYVCVFGFLSIDNPYTNPTPPPDSNGLLTTGQQRVIIAPLYGPIDKDNSGSVWYRKYDILNQHDKMKNDADVILFVENIVKKNGAPDTFDASFILIATWSETKATGTGFDKSKTSTFQVVLVTDGKYTYVFYIYGNGLMEWVYNLSNNLPVWVGFTADSLTYTNAYSFSDAALHLDSQLTAVSSNEQEVVAGLIFKALNTQGKTTENPAVDCIRWYNENFENKKRLDYIASLTPECPCDIRLSRFDPWFWQINFQRWRTDIKYACVDMLHVGNFGHYGKSCCYDLKTWLWVYERPYAGGFQLYNKRHPLKHTLNDENPKTSCCESSDYCNLFYELRPIGSCYRRSPYNFGTFWGDPHFSTLDSMNFTFNGLGEYTLLQVDSSNCTFDIQARTERVMKQDGTLSDATVFAAFAAKYSINSSVHVERNRERNGLNIYGNKVDLTNVFNANTNSSNPFQWSPDDNSFTISKRNGSVYIFFPACEISLTISINAEMLTLNTLVPETLKNATKGLLGNYDDDPFNDFTLWNGTVLRANLTEREIFEYAKTWAINPNNSAFVYDTGKSHKDYHNDSYVPRFLDEAAPALRTKAVELCNGSRNVECVFDYVFTENTQVAEETLKIKGQSNADKEEIGETVPTLTGCSPISAVKGKNASCKVNASDEVEVISSNANAVFDRDSSTITYYQDTDEPVDIRITSTNGNGRSSPTLVLEVILCTGCNGHGECSNATRIDPRRTEYFKYATCVCEPQYEGIDCEKELDGCATSPCSLNRSCEKLTAHEQKAHNKSYRCGPCPEGFTKDSKEDCIDLDECASDNGGCDHNCTNTEGSFECTCFDGYRPTIKDKNTCRDINECDEALHTCDHLCNNTEGGFACDCFPGYEFNATSWSCQRTSDEICTEQKKTECVNAHGCTLKDGVPGCLCTNGYELNENGTQCRDIDECNTGVCPQNCVNTAGSFECLCYKGYRKQGLATCTECDVLHWGENCEQTCVCNGRGANRCDPVKGCICEAGWTGENCNNDTNECEILTQACNDARQECINSLGSYSCGCKHGFYKTKEGNCEDTDECSDPQLKTCMQDCENTIGGYTCSCKDGYTKASNTTCKDIDECELGTAACEQRCANNEGLYSCFCHFGYSINDDRRTCSKISDPCLTIENLNCSHFCLIGKEHLKCGCRKGFMIDSDNVTCIDIDECTETGVNKCDVDADCTNTVGSYLCTCPVGKQLENDGRTCSECDVFHFGENCSQKCSCLNGVCDKKTGCVCDTGWAGSRCDIDIDECATHQVMCINKNTVCVNVLGSATCSCETGYWNNSGVCQDIDECATEICEHNCINTDGSFSCTCEKGFALNERCIDIDECSGIHGCNQICDNTVGSYRCLCESGFRLDLNDRKTCIPEHECSEVEKTKCMNHSSCYVIEGAAHCACQKGYQNVSGACEDINECSTSPCSQTCENVPGSFKCSCNEGYSLSHDSVTCQECTPWQYGTNCNSNCICKQQSTEQCDSVTGNCVCTAGWTGTKCDEDIDECNTGTSCPDNSVCENRDGSFTCKCSIGYFKTGGGDCDECDYRHYGNNCFNKCTCNFEHTDDCHHETGLCICKQGWKGENCSEDINECTDTPYICEEKPNSTCMNNVGSFQCECNTGFLETNDTCTACMNGYYGNKCIEECNCTKDNTESCHHVTGICTCNEGWTDTLCSKDINECKSIVNVCLNKANSTCENTNGSYICSCNDGFRAQGDICTDCEIWMYGQNCLSECTCNTTNSKYCHPTTGECTCEIGWNGTNCEGDIDECTIETVCQEHSTCKNYLGSFDCKCNEGFIEMKMGTCDECTGNTYGENCTNQCYCHVTNSDNEHQTCDAVTGQCKCKPNWEGETCSEDVNECERHSALCVNEDHKTCVNTEGWFVCDCIRGFTESLNGNCVEDIGISTEIPAGEIRFELRVTIDVSLPGGTNINASSTFESLRRKCDSSLLGFLRRFTADSVQIIVTDIMIASQVVVDYTIVQKTKVATTASKLTQVVLELQQGSFVNFDGLNVSASSEYNLLDVDSPFKDWYGSSVTMQIYFNMKQNSYKGLEPCQVYKETIGICDDGYTCEVENGIPDCKREEKKSQVNWAMVIGLSAAGLFLIIATAILIVAVWHLRIKRHRKAQRGRHRKRENVTGSKSRANCGEDNLGMTFPSRNAMSSRDDRAFQQPYHIPRATMDTRRSDREYSFY